MAMLRIAVCITMQKIVTEIPMDTGDDGFVVNPYLQLGHFSSIFQARWASQVAPVVKNLPANAGDIRDVGSISGSGRFSAEGNGYPLQYSCLENSMDRGAWRAFRMREK